MHRAVVLILLLVLLELLGSAGSTSNGTSLATAAASEDHEAHAEHACAQLVALGQKFNCDKFDGGHAYQNIYCDLFSTVRGAPHTMLEIGFGCGHFKGQNGMSALVWKAFFHRLDYYAIDYIPQKDAEMSTCAADYERDHPGVVKKLWIGDQSDTVFLAKVLAEFSPPGANNKFGIIIDDGAHLYNCIKASFQTLWPHVAPGGVYVVEDMAADYKFSRVVAKWIERLSFGVATQSEHFEDFENILPKDVKTIVCAYQICVFKKARRYETLPNFVAGHPFANADIKNTTLD